MSRCAVRAARAVCVCVCFSAGTNLKRASEDTPYATEEGYHTTQRLQMHEKKSHYCLGRCNTKVLCALSRAWAPPWRLRSPWALSFLFFLSQHLSASVRVAVIDRVCMYASERSGPPFFFHSVAPWSIEAARPAGQQGKPDARTHAHAGHSQPTTKRHCKGGKEADTARTQKQTRK